METMREQCHKDLVLATLSLDFCSAPVVANGVLVCNDNREGLIGLDAESGKQLWGPVPNCIRKTSAPLVWRHEDKNYIVSAFNRAVCLEPKTGKLIWEIGEDVANQGTPAICENYMVTGVGVKGSGVTCFKISPSGAQKHWSLPPQYACHVTSPVIYKGHVYCFAGGGMAICVDLESGKIVGAASFYSVRSCSSFVAAEGRIVRPHLYNKLLLYDADPEKFRQLGAIWTAPSYGENTTPAIADGRLVFRGKDCVYCYDLRRRAEDGR
jgi:outer membrane protein assembly factor BamB